MSPSKFNPRKSVGRWFRKRIGHQSASFIGHSSNYFIGTLFAKGLGFITVPIFTRLLTPGDYGAFAVFNAATELLFMFFSLNMDTSLQRLYFDKDENFAEILGSNLIFILAWSATLFALTTALSPLISRYLELSPGLFIMATLAAMFSVVFHLWSGNNRARLKSGLNMRLSVLMQTLNAGTAILLTLQMSEERYMGRVWARLVTHGIFAVIGVIVLARAASGPFRWRHVGSTLRFGIPLIPSTFSNRILVSSDRIIIKWLVDEASAGLYAFVYNVSYLGSVLGMVLDKALGPMMFKALRDDNNQDVKELSKIYMVLMALGNGVLILFAAELVRIMAPPQYHSAVFLMPPIIWSYYLEGVGRLISKFYNHEKRSALVSAISVTAAVLNIGLNFWLIPIWGYGAAAWTTLISYFVLITVKFMFLRSFRRNIPLSWKAISISTVLMTVFTGIYYAAESITLPYWAILTCKTVVFILITSGFGLILLKRFKIRSE